MGLQVSIPHRYSTTDNFDEFNNLLQFKFQFLIGTVQRNSGYMTYDEIIVFQFLIGTVQRLL